MTHSSVPQKKDLERYRYDAKLYKQAYKAGKEAKRIEARVKQLKYIRIGISILTTIAVVMTITWILSHLPKKYSYIQAHTDVNNEYFLPKDMEINPSGVSSTEFEEIFVNARSAIYADLETGHIFYKKNSEKPLPIASLTKLMTAIVALDNYQLDDVVEVKQNWYEQEEMSWSLELDKGDSITVESLLNAMLISSYNDAAYTLADHYEGGWEEFVVEMNNHAEILGLVNTHFSNPAGLDSEEGNISTVEELYMVMTIIYKNEVIMDIMNKSYADLSWDIGSKRIFTTSSILNQYGNVAGKTGITDDAGQCFLGVTQDGRVTIVLDSIDRFADTKKLLLQSH
ncbi:serine hydrolase [bacterium]|nr:serine hydrolase [bacterium]